MTGWKCPGCGRCYAPFVGECGACKPTAVSATGTGATAAPPAYFNRFTQTGTKVLEVALREALAYGHNYIAPSHIVGAIRRVDPDALTPPPDKEQGRSCNDVSQACNTERSTDA